MSAIIRRMKYAVIKTGGKQYKVKESETISVDRLEGEEGKEIIFPSVLLHVQDGDVMIGAPFLKDISVHGKLLGQRKGEKLRISKYKAKVRYRRTTGYRHSLSDIKIEKIVNALEIQPKLKKEKKIAA